MLVRGVVWAMARGRCFAKVFIGYKNDAQLCLYWSCPYLRYLRLGPEARSHCQCRKRVSRGRRRCSCHVKFADCGRLTSVAAYRVGQEQSA